MAMVFASIYNRLLTEMTEQLVEVVRQNPDNLEVTEAAIRATIEKTIVESCILFQTESGTVLVRKPETYSTCKFVVSRGERAGCECGARVNTKKSTELCTVHLKVIEKANSSRKCAYVPEKGARKGEVCGANIKIDGDFCSKHCRSSKSASDASEDFDSDEAPASEKPVAKASKAPSPTKASTKASTKATTKAPALSDSRLAKGNTKSSKPPAKGSNKPQTPAKGKVNSSEISEEFVESSEDSSSYEE